MVGPAVCAPPGPGPIPAAAQLHVGAKQPLTRLQRSLGSPHAVYQQTLRLFRLLLETLALYFIVPLVKKRACEGRQRPKDCGERSRHRSP